MKQFFILVTLMCVTTLQAYAQEDEVAKALKYAEQQMELADKNPKNGKMQYDAGMALISNTLSDKKDPDRALPYLERALKIAEEQTVMKDTLMGLTCMGLSMIYGEKQDFAKSTDYMERAIDAFEQELGKHDPVTNGMKLILGWMTMGAQTFRAFPLIQEAFYYNETAPQDKRIENMAEANIAMEVSLEMLIAAYTRLFRYALPLIPYNGKGCLIIQTPDWNMERPIIGWMVPNLLRSEEEKEAFKGDDTLIIDDNGQIIVIPKEDKVHRSININFRHYLSNPRKLESNEGDTRLWFLSPEAYADILAKYREYKSKQK